ncbi:MAG: hypothetical protein ACOVNZ_10800 [Crocinitomicaceae bacterium]
MKKNKKIIALISFLVLIGGIFVYRNFSGENSNVKKQVQEPKVESAVTEISTDFNLNSFNGIDEEKLLKELKICDSTMKEDNSLDRPACSPKFFRFFPLKNGKSLKEGFILLVRSGVNGFPVRRLLIFERSNGKLVNTNRFVGYIIEKRKKSNSYDDIVVRFFERYENQKYFYHCLYSWNNGKYDFVRCEEINSERIKPELIDSVSLEVQKILNEKSLVY